MTRTELMALKDGYVRAEGYPGYGMVDFHDLNDGALSEAGVLEVPSAGFQHGPITLELGCRLGETATTLLNIDYFTPGELKGNHEDPEDRTARGFYTVANPDSGQVLFLDDAQDFYNGTVRLKGATFDGKPYDITREMFGGKSVTIGQGEHDCGLELGPQVDPVHVYFSVGNVRRNLHISDGITRGGTRAFIPMAAYRTILNHHVPARYYSNTPKGELISVEQIQGRWARNGVGCLAEGVAKRRRQAIETQ